VTGEPGGVKEICATPAGDPYRMLLVFGKHGQAMLMKQLATKSKARSRPWAARCRFVDYDDFLKELKS
jgi:hypothetical protein